MNESVVRVKARQVFDASLLLFKECGVLSQEDVKFLTDELIKRTKGNFESVGVYFVSEPPDEYARILEAEDFVRKTKTVFRGLKKE